MSILRNRLPAAILLLILLTVPLFSQDQETDSQGESLFQPVMGLETWRQDIDISEYKAGTYNIIIEGIDKAGNKYVEGPYNIYIDPESDKPVVNISNPEPEMKVNGNLNIIGTCVDDDGVLRVEVKLDEGNFITASGAEFWSYYLETAGMEDGPHLLTVRGIDKNSLPGNERTVEFILDRAAPVNEITSIRNGALVNGQIILEGRTSDKNGIDKLEISTDGGINYSEIPVKINRKAFYADFKLKIDTRELEDGPQIYWLKSTDTTGSVGISSFLFFVDNRPPALDILYPGEETPVNGKFTVIGSAADEVGVDRLLSRVGREENEIPLTVGDQYWYQEFDFTGMSKADITFILTDKTGNSTEYRMQKDLDPESDKPLLELVSPLPDNKYSEAVIAGFVVDDDGPGSIIYSIDGGAPVQKSALYAFNIREEGLAPGPHKLEIYAADDNGVTSDTVKLQFSIVLGKPEITLDQIIPTEGDTPLKFIQAAEINQGEYKSIEGRVTFQNEAGSAYFSLNGNEEKKISLKKIADTEESTFSIALKGIEPGYHEILVRAYDAAGITADETFYIMIRPPEAGVGTKKLYSADNRFFSSGKPAGGIVRIGEKDEIVFFLDGDQVSKAGLSEPLDFLKLSSEGSRVILKSTGAGFSENISLHIDTVSGKEHTIGPFSVGSDEEPPSLTLEEDLNGSLVSQELIISGEVSDNIGLKELSYSINGGKYNEIAVAEGEFRQNDGMSTLSDGGVSLVVRAVDNLGNTAEQHFYLVKDSHPPRLSQLAPLPSKDANGVVNFIGRVEDASAIQSIEYSSDGENFTLVENKPFPVGTIDLTMAESDGANHIFRIVDAAGNVSETKPAFRINSDADTPTVQIQIPEDGALIQNNFIISGMAFDDDQIDSLWYRIDGGEFLKDGSGNNFEIPVAIADIEDNAHTIEVKAIDLNGVESETASIEIFVSRNEPVSTLESPDIESTVSGIVQVKGMSADENGIESVLISYDNGNTFNSTDLTPASAAAENEGEQTEGESAESVTEQPEAEPVPNKEVLWIYDLETKLLEDGSHSLLLKAVDRYGVTGLYTTLINVDNTPPEIEIDGPDEGLLVAGTAELKGRLTDNIELTDVSIEIQHLSEPELTERIQLPLDEVLLQELDLSAYPAGWLNLRITATDKTGNTSSVSRNIRRLETLNTRKVSILTPAKGAGVTGDLVVQGRAENFSGIETAVLLFDGDKISELDVSDTGYFNTVIERGKISGGEHSLSVAVTSDDGSKLESEPVKIGYTRLGPWIKIENFTAGDFAAQRPWITGSAGYEYLPPPGLDEKELEIFGRTHEVTKVEVSLDNGKTFNQAHGREEWKYRLETQELSPGELWVIARARFRNGESSVFKTLLIVDEEPPRVELLYPGEGMRFNESLSLIGTAEDDYGLEQVSAAIREGNKNQYQVPSFIQGLYVDTHFMGATYADLGIGLTFFDDNVKLQGDIGIAPPGRFTGMTLGLKLLANIAVLPWEYFFGYDFKDFSSSVAVGTTFKYFTMPEEEGEVFGDAGIFLGAMIAQLELVKYSIPDWDMFSSYSFYTEMQFWFISSDVDAGVESRLSFGLRADVF